jgi:hypothetical protein
MKYQVRLTQIVIEEAYVEVEADNKFDAAEMALAIGNEGDADWQFVHAPEPIVVSTIKEVLDESGFSSGAGVDPILAAFQRAKYNRAKFEAQWDEAAGMIVGVNPRTGKPFSLFPWHVRLWRFLRRWWSRRPQC